MAIKAAGDQTRVFTRALSAEEKKRMRLAAQQDASVQAAARTAGAVPSSDAAAARQRAQEIQQQSQAMRERDRIMSAGTQQERNQYLTQQNADRLAASGVKGAAQTAQALRTARVMNTGTQTQKAQYLAQQALAQRNAYQSAVAQATPTQMQDYISFARKDAGFQSGMDAEDQASWDAIGKKYASGDTSWNRDANSFREDGKWGSYTDANGKINGWLYAADGTGGYAPVFGGKVGESGYQAGTVFYAPDGSAYTMAADGTLTKSGTVEWLKYGQSIGPKAGYHYSGGSFLGQDENGSYRYYDYDTVSDADLERFGYYRDGDAIMPINNDYYIAKGLKNGGISKEQLRAAQVQAANAKAAATGAGGGHAGSDYGGYIPGGGAGGSPGDSSAGGYASTVAWTTAPVPSGGGSSAGPAGSTPPPGAAPQPPRNEWQAYLDQYDYGDAPEWDGSAYEQRRDEALKRAENIRWGYDPDTDPVWQAYQKQYRREGQRAAQDALGRYAAMTGGVPSSYAMTAASQAGDYYAARLSDKLPELYDNAYTRYLREYERQLGLADAYEGYGKTEYDRYRDRLAQWNADRAFLYGLNRDAISDARYEDEQAYQRAWDEEAREYSRGRDALSDRRYADELAYDRAYQEKRDAILDDRADRAWAQELRTYADAQGWKAAEWEQYLREYGDQLSETEHRWAYEMAQDAEDRQREAEETAWQRDLRTSGLAYDRERDAEADRRWETQYQQSLREYDDTQKQREFDNAMKRLQVFGYVRAEDAEILGMPAGTRLEDYSAGSGGSGQRTAGKTKTAASAKDAAENSGMEYSGTHPDGRKRTAGYGELKTMLRNALIGGSRDPEQLRRVIDDWAAKGRIEDYEAAILQREFGLDGTARGGASGGKALQYTK